MVVVLFWFVIGDISLCKYTKKKQIMATAKNSLGEEF